MELASCCSTLWPAWVPCAAKKKLVQSMTEYVCLCLSVFLSLCKFLRSPHHPHQISYNDHHHQISWPNFPQQEVSLIINYSSKTKQQVGLVTRKERKTQHQNPEFGHTQGEIQQPKKKNLQNSTLAFNRGKNSETHSSILVVNWVSSCLSSFLSASTAVTYIFTTPNCTTTIVSLEPCALNAEY